MFGAVPLRETSVVERLSLTGCPRCLGPTVVGHSGDLPSTHSAVTTLRSWPSPLRCGELAATVRCSLPRNVSSISEPSCPTPTCTKTLTPSSYIASINGRKRTGSNRCRTISVLTSASLAG